MNKFTCTCTVLLVASCVAVIQGSRFARNDEEGGSSSGAEGENAGMSNNHFLETISGFMDKFQQGGGESAREEGAGGDSGGGLPGFGNFGNIGGFAPTGVPEIPTGVPEIPTGVPEIPTGVPEIPTGVPEIPTGVPEIPAGVPGAPGGSGGGDGSSGSRK